MQEPRFDPRLDELEPNLENFTVDELAYEETRLRAKANGTDDRTNSCQCDECHVVDSQYRKMIHRGLLRKLDQ